MLEGREGEVKTNGKHMDREGGSYWGQGEERASGSDGEFIHDAAEAEDTEEGSESEDEADADTCDTWAEGPAQGKRGGDL